MELWLFIESVAASTVLATGCIGNAQADADFHGGKIMSSNIGHGDGGGNDLG